MAFNRQTLITNEFEYRQETREDLVSSRHTYTRTHTHRYVHFVLSEALVNFQSTAPVFVPLSRRIAHCNFRREMTFSCACFMCVTILTHLLAARVPAPTLCALLAAQQHREYTSAVVTYRLRILRNIVALAAKWTRLV